MQKELDCIAAARKDGGLATPRKVTIRQNLCHNFKILLDYLTNICYNELGGDAYAEKTHL